MFNTFLLRQLPNGYLAPSAISYLSFIPSQTEAVKLDITILNFKKRFVFNTNPNNTKLLLNQKYVLFTPHHSYNL